MRIFWSFPLTGKIILEKMTDSLLYFVWKCIVPSSEIMSDNHYPLLLLIFASSSSSVKTRQGFRRNALFHNKDWISIWSIPYDIFAEILILAKWKRPDNHWSEEIQFPPFPKVFNSNIWVMGSRWIYPICTNDNALVAPRLSHLDNIPLTALCAFKDFGYQEIALPLASGI